MFRKKKEIFYYLGQEVPINPDDKYKCLDMATRGALQQANARITIVMLVFGLCFAIIAGRLFQLSVMNYQSRQFTPSVLKTEIDFSRYNIFHKIWKQSIIDYIRFILLMLCTCSTLFLASILF